MAKPAVTIIPATPGFVLIVACFPGKSRDGGAYVGLREPIIAWAVESDYRGHVHNPELHCLVTPVTFTGAQHCTNECAVLRPDGKLDEVGTSSRFDTINDWLTDVDELAKLEVA